MLAKLTASSAEPEDPAIAIHRLLGLLETVVDQQAHLIEEMMDPGVSKSHRLHLRVVPPQQ
jgi:hypothetical protein